MTKKRAHEPGYKPVRNKAGKISWIPEKQETPTPKLKKEDLITVSQEPFTETSLPNEKKEWRTNGILHRVGGPAVMDPDGTEEWWHEGKRHNEHGPAVIQPNGFTAWYVNGELHREDGPAVEYANGYKAWFKHGNLHNENGPAITRKDNSLEWWLNGIQMQSFKEWKYSRPKPQI